MTKYTADDFTQAARAESEGKFPPPRESAVIYPISAVRSRSRGAFLAGAGWARTYLAEQEPTEATTPDPSVDYHAMWWKAEREREKAERERDEARARLAEATAEIRAQGEAIAELAAEPRPLTPDAITDEMVGRVRDRMRERGIGFLSSYSIRELLIVALTEPPARPEGAEEWEDWLIEAMPHESMPDEDIARLADQIADHLATPKEKR